MERLPAELPDGVALSACRLAYDVSFPIVDNKPMWVFLLRLDFRFEVSGAAGGDFSLGSPADEGLDLDKQVIRYLHGHNLPWLGH